MYMEFEYGCSVEKYAEKRYPLDIDCYESETAWTGCHKNIVGVIVYE